MVQMETLKTNMAEECKRGKYILAFVLCYIRCVYTHMFGIVHHSSLLHGVQE